MISKNSGNSFIQKTFFFHKELITTQRSYPTCWGRTARKTLLSVKLEGARRKNTKKWWKIMIFWALMEKKFFKKIAIFFKSDGKQLYCVVWYYKTYGVDYYDVLRSLYHWIWVILHFAVSERLVTRHFLKNDMKIRKNAKIKIRRPAIDSSLPQHVAFQK